MTWQIMGTAHLGVPDVGKARCVCDTSPKGQDGCPLHQVPVRVIDGASSASPASTFRVGGQLSIRLESIAVWRVVQCGPTTAWLSRGWFLHTCRPHATYTPIAGWRLWRHRVLWGFTRGLVDAR